jgi:hypothetical protein
MRGGGVCGGREEQGELIVWEVVNVASNAKSGFVDAALGGDVFELVNDPKAVIFAAFLDEDVLE